MCWFCLILYITRIVFTGSLSYFFLNWNLFLAAVPWIISHIIYSNEEIKTRKLLILPLLFLWVLFLPNAPYILTDLFHLKNQKIMPLWFDWLMILAYGLTGLSFGIYSIKIFENIISKTVNILKRKLIISLLLFLVSFGVFIGRYLRWNSWDFISNPLPLFSDLAERVLNPFHYPGTWGMTILYGILLNILYHTPSFEPQKKSTILHESKNESR